MKSTKTRYVVSAAITCFVLESRLPAQQSSTNNNDLSYTTLGRRATTINNDNGSQPHLGTPLSSHRNTSGEPPQHQRRAYQCRRRHRYRTLWLQRSHRQ